MSSEPFPEVSELSLWLVTLPWRSGYIIILGRYVLHTISLLSVFFIEASSKRIVLKVTLERLYAAVRTPTKILNFSAKMKVV